MHPKHFTRDVVLLIALVIAMPMIQDLHRRPLARAAESFDVSGVVRGTDGGGVGGVQVFFFDLNQGMGFTGDITAADGSYHATVASSTYNVVFNPPCQRGLASTVRTGLVVDKDLVVNIDLVGGFSVMGRVTDSQGTPIAGGGIFAFNTQTFVGFGLPPADATGQYCFSLEPSCYELTFTPTPFRGAAPVSLRDVCGPPDQTRDVSYLPGFTISGVVIDSRDGQGEAGVEIFAFDPAVGGFGFAPTVANPAGAYVGSLPAGTWDIQFMPRPFSGLQSVTTVNVTGPPDRVLDLPLAAGVTISGTIIDAMGAAVSGVFVFMDPLGPSAPGDDLRGWGTFSDVNGVYGKALRKWLYKLTFSPPPQSGLCQAVIIVVAGKDKQRHIQLQPCP